MTPEDLTKILLAGGFLLLGALLTAIRAKIVAAKKKNNFHLIFYIVSSLLILAAILTLFICWNELIKPDWPLIIAVAVTVSAGVALILFTKKNLVGKFQYNTRELDPIVNRFTRNADKDNIRLLAGDINFFGNTPDVINNNSQYICLRNEQFRNIQILCVKPINNPEKIRYGKILHELHVEMRFYHPPLANLNIRGRMKTLNNVPHLLMYNKIESNLYETLELDTANSNGAMYDRIWDLVWHLAEELTANEKAEYIHLYSA